MTIAYDTLLKPTLSVYRDINEYGGTYFNLSIAHSFPVYKEITLASSIMKCNTWESRKVSAILSVYGKTI